MTFLASLMSFLTGFLSLAMELLWVRIFSYANQIIPQAFAFVLVFYLSGIAFGALIGKRFCDVYHNLGLTCGATLVASSVNDLIGPFVYSQIAYSGSQMGVGAGFIFMSALLKAVIFPIAHFLGTPLSDTSIIGRKVSRVYGANILGATLGPIFVTYLLLPFFTTQQAVIFCAILTFGIGAGCLINQIRPKVLSSITALMMLVFAGFLSLNSHFLIKKISARGKIKRIIENQYGIIVIYDFGKEDIVFGGNAYDGRTNLDPISNSNRINRLLILPALHEKPQSVLIIGLSIGTWLKLVTSFPNVEKIDVIEINSGYLEAIKDYPPQLQGIKDPRVNLVIDDGRRWLKNHPDKKYDLIIMNMTFHWRAYSSNLLSKNFLELLKNHMLPNAILAYNATGSPDAFKTAAVVFNHAYLYENFVIAADFDWRNKLSRPQARLILSGLKIDGTLLFPPDKRSFIDYFLNEPVTTLLEMESMLGRPTEVITDHNLITEYKYGQ